MIHNGRCTINITTVRPIVIIGATPDGNVSIIHDLMPDIGTDAYHAYCLTTGKHLSPSVALTDDDEAIEIWRDGKVQTVRSDLSTACHTFAMTIVPGVPGLPDAAPGGEVRLVLSGLDPTGGENHRSHPGTIRIFRYHQPSETYQRISLSVNGYSGRRGGGPSMDVPRECPLPACTEV